MSENYTVYMHRFPNGKVYIGMTSKKPEDRWKRGSGYRTQNVFKAILKYGRDNKQTSGKLFRKKQGKSKAMPTKGKLCRKSKKGK